MMTENIEYVPSDMYVVQLVPNLSEEDKDTLDGYIAEPTTLRMIKQITEI